MPWHINASGSNGCVCARKARKEEIQDHCPGSRLWLVRMNPGNHPRGRKSFAHGNNVNNAEVHTHKVLGIQALHMLGLPNSLTYLVMGSKQKVEFSVSIPIYSHVP